MEGGSERWAVRLGLGDEAVRAGRCRVIQERDVGCVGDAGRDADYYRKMAGK